MNLDFMLDVLKVLVPAIGLGLYFFFYFKNPDFRAGANKVLAFLPTILGFASRFVKDKKGVFDTHDALVVMGNVSARIKEVIEDPANQMFGDVEDEVMQILQIELSKYKNLPGVPNLMDNAVRVQVQVVFESIQRAMREDSTGNDS